MPSAIKRRHLSTRHRRRHVSDFVRVCIVGISSVFAMQVVAAEDSDCSIADIFVNSWIRIAQANESALPVTTAMRKDLTFNASDGTVLRGYSYVADASEIAPTGFVLLLQGNATAASSMADVAISLADSTREEVVVYEYRGFGKDSKVRPSMASIQGDVDAIVADLVRRRRRGTLIGVSMGGIFAARSLLRYAPATELRVLLDSVPAQIPRIPFFMWCPASMSPVNIVTSELARRVGVIYGEDDGLTKDSASKELMERVRQAHGNVWIISRGHATLSARDQLVRVPLYSEFVSAGVPR